MLDKFAKKYCARLLILALITITVPDVAFAETVERIIDGDTLLLDNGEKVRLIGVDTPETKHPKKPVEHFGREAAAFTKGIVLGKEVELTYEQKIRDKYGRLLAYVYRVDDGLFLNAEIIKQGFGFAYTKYPFKYLDVFREYEKQARKQKKGLWAPPEKAVSIAKSDMDVPQKSVCDGCPEWRQVSDSQYISGGRKAYYENFENDEALLFFYAEEENTRFSFWRAFPADLTQSIYAELIRDDCCDGDLGNSLEIHYDVDSENSAKVKFSIANSMDLSSYRELRMLARTKNNNDVTGIQVEIEDESGNVSAVRVATISGGHKWTPVQIPLAKFKQIKRWSEISKVSIVFLDESVSPRQGSVLIDDIFFYERPSAFLKLLGLAE